MKKPILVVCDPGEIAIAWITSGFYYSNAYTWGIIIEEEKY